MSELLTYALFVRGLTAISILLTGETDWKIIAIDVNDPLASQMNGMCLIIILKNGYPYSCEILPTKYLPFSRCW